MNELLNDMKRFDNKWGNVDIQLAMATYPLNQVGVKKVLEHIENLHSKIDKANEILDKWGEEPDADMYMQIKEYKEWKELKDILKVEMNE